MNIRKLQMGAVAVLVWAQVGLPQISIGPYVQRVGTDRATVVWYTDSTTAGVLKYGTARGPWLGSLKVAAGTVHAAEVTGLQPNTKYFYEVSDGKTTLATGTDYYFKTHVAAGARVPFSFIAAGDLGDGSTAQVEVAARKVPLSSTDASGLPGGFFHGDEASTARVTTTRAAVGTTAEAPGPPDPGVVSVAVSVAATGRGLVAGSCTWT